MNNNNYNNVELKMIGGHYTDEHTHHKSHLHHDDKYAKYHGSTHRFSFLGSKICIILLAILLILLIGLIVIFVTTGSKKKECKYESHNYGYQPLDGTGNTKLHHEYAGTVNEAFGRYAHAVYGDNHHSPAGQYRPNPRYISNIVCKHDDDEDDNTIDDDNYVAPEDDDDDKSDKHDDDNDEVTQYDDDNHSNTFMDDDNHIDDDNDPDDDVLYKDDDDLYQLAKKKAIHSKRGLSSILIIMGQLYDHMVILTPTDNTDQMHIDVTGDPVYDPEGHGKEMVVNRSIHTPDDDDDYSVREQKNNLSSYVDGSAFYGTNEHRLSKLRSYEYGKMRMSDNDMLPYNEYNLDNEPDTSPYWFVAGDVRANEQPGLTALHILFVREHNRLCDKYHLKYPTWDDEKLFQTARKIVIGKVQKILYEDFIPALTGTHLENNCYNDKYPTDPRIYNEFGIIYRFGHSMVSDFIELRDPYSGKVTKHFPLKDVFFNIQGYRNGSMQIDEVLLGLCHQHAEELDIRIVNSMRNAEVHGEPFDLASFNIIRGRDHGIPDFDTLRRKMGGHPVQYWNDVTKDPKIAKRLEKAYGEYGWRDLDPWVGMLAEDHYPGCSLGYTARSIILDQFQRLRDGDRYYYKWDEQAAPYIDEIDSCSLKQIIIDNTNIYPDLLNHDVFFV